MKINYLKCLLTMLLLLCCSVINAHEFEVDGIYYVTDETNKTVAVTYKGDSYNDYSDEYTGSVVIPASVIYSGRTYSVTYIDDHAFYNCTGLTSITIGNSVTSIGDYAFSECTGLENVTIGNSVTDIGGRAFFGCIGLTNITIPNSVATFGDYAFYDCTGLASVTIPNSVNYIGYRAFGNCSGLTSVTVASGNPVYDSRDNCNAIIETASNTLIFGCMNTTIPNSVINIGELAFRGCTSLASIEIPNSVTSIGNYAFMICTGLESITIPNSVKSIGESAFEGCTGLTSIEIPNSVTSIGSEAFYNCTGLTSIVVENGNTIYDSRNNCNAIIETATNALIAGCKNTVISNSVTSIGNDAFYGCTGLTSIEIPNSVTSIGSYAFQSCIGLASITIPNSVTSIGSGAFYNCTGLTSVTIGSGVTSIGYMAFYGCTGLASITIPNSVTSIGYMAFSGCTGLTSIEIPNSVTSIGRDAFEGCTGLTSIEIPNSVTSIGSGAFYNCIGLTSVTIPNSVTSIGDFAFKGCTGLESITVNSKTPPTIQYDTFDGVTATLYVPYGAKATYQAANYWKNIANVEELPGEYSLAVTAAGYATLYLGFNAEIPDGVEVYYAKSVEGDLLKMEQVTDYLPANTGVIVKAKEGTYTFNETEESVAAIEGNLLKGTEKATTVKAKSNAQYYVLSKVDGVVGMYLAQLTDGGFLNNANEAYLELTLGDLGIYDDEVDSSVNGVQFGAGYRFDFGGATGVSELKTQNGNVKTIYDLQGRKVEMPTNGIYIINGKKILVK